MILLLSLLYWGIYSVYIVYAAGEPKEKVIFVQNFKKTTIPIEEDQYLCFNIYPYTYSFGGKFIFTDIDNNTQTLQLTVNDKYVKTRMDMTKEENIEEEGNRFLARTFTNVIHKENKPSPEHMTVTALKGPVTIHADFIEFDSYVQILYIETDKNKNCYELKREFKKKTDELKETHDIIIPFKWHDKFINKDYYVEKSNVVIIDLWFYGGAYSILKEYTTYSECDNNGKSKGKFNQAKGVIKLKTIFPLQYSSYTIDKPIHLSGNNKGTTFAIGKESCDLIKVPKKAQITPDVSTDINDKNNEDYDNKPNTPHTPNKDTNTPNKDTNTSNKDTNTSNKDKPGGDKGTHSPDTSNKSGIFGLSSIIIIIGVVVAVVVILSFLLCMKIHTRTHISSFMCVHVCTCTT
eukprot:GHVR01159757.1.p1 GENE.GHVR01159757.1~~GHVR01159757.1.p1  ORF type:complete len:420 (+),score=93.61 GHVR01159757.1:47-1261(+)